MMAEACLGRALDKSERLSAWADRPLDPDQLTYAGESWLLSCSSCRTRSLYQYALL